MKMICGGNLFLEYLSPMRDCVFKRIFGDPNNLYNILADFLKAVITDLQNYESEELIHGNKAKFVKVGI